MATKQNNSLSVIVPTFNRSGFVRKCVRSLLDSGVGGIEVIVVDDGSTDDTEEVVRSFGPPAHYIYQENSGVAVARNTGFAASTGRYVAYLDCDDQWIVGGPERLVRVLDEHSDVPLVFGDARMGTFEAGFESFVGKFGRDDFPALPATRIAEGVRRLERRPFLHRLARRNVVFLGSLLLRREVVERTGGFEPSLSGAADWEFFLRLASQYDFTYCEDTPASIYLQHPGGMSNDRGEMNREFARALRSALKKVPLDPVDRRHLEAQVARMEFAFGFQAYDRGDLEAARGHFASSIQQRYQGRALALWLACHLPSGLVSRARDLKRRICG